MFLELILFYVISTLKFSTHNVDIYIIWNEYRKAWLFPLREIVMRRFETLNNCQSKLLQERGNRRNHHPMSTNTKPNLRWTFVRPLVYIHGESKVCRFIKFVFSFSFLFNHIDKFISEGRIWVCEWVRKTIKHYFSYKKPCCNSKLLSVIRIISDYAGPISSLLFNFI